MGTLEQFERESFVSSRKPQLLAAFAMSIGAYGVGNVCAWSAPALPDLESSQYFGELSVSEKSWCASIVPLGALTAGPFAGFMVDKFGRRLTALLLSVPFMLGWLTIAFAPTMTVLIAARFVTGLCVGFMSVIIPMYLAEISEEKIRGALSNLFPLMAGLGILNMYVFGLVMDWFWLALSNSLVPAVLLGMVYFLPESPVFLLSKGRTEKARKALMWFRGAATSEQIEPELQQFRRGIDEKKDRKLSAKEFFSPAVLKPNVICLTLMFFQQMSGRSRISKQKEAFNRKSVATVYYAISGINAVVFYTVSIFEAAGTSISPNLSSVIVGIALLVSITVSAFLIDNVGRRILLILSDSGMALGLLGLGVFFYLKEQKSLEMGEVIDYCSQNATATEGGSTVSTPADLAWLPLTSLMVFVLSFNLGYGPVPWLYLGELLPAHVKGFGAGLATAFSWMMAFLVTKSFQDFICHLGTSGCFWMFGLISAVGAVYCILFVPETKGKTLDEIQRGFQ